jgi:serine/threonine protein phosphatase PrpC
VKLRTLDHSVPQMLVFAREIKEKQIRNHPDRNRLLRVMGIEWEKPMYELAEQTQLEKYQAFLLCSDGFWELIDEKQMCKLLKNSSTVEEWMQAMVEVIKQNGIGKNMDNYTAIALWC